METRSKSPFSIIESRRVEIGRRLRGIDQSLQLLATINSASLEAVSSESMDDIRKRLLQETTRNLAEYFMGS